MKTVIKNPLPLRRNLGLAVGLLLSLSALVLSLLPAEWRPLCRFSDWTGLPCPSCGATRCLHLTMQGDLSAAFMMQPLFFVSAAVFGVWFFFTLASAVFRWPTIRIELESRREKLGVLLLAGLLISTNWTYLILVH